MKMFKTRSYIFFILLILGGLGISTAQDNYLIPIGDTQQNILHEKKSKKGYAIKDTEAFIKPIVEKIKVGTDDAYIVSFRLYTLYDIKGISVENYPEFEGFKVEKNPYANNRIFIDKYKGKSYYAVDLKSVILIPQNAGKRTIPKGSVNIVFTIKTNEVEPTPFGYIRKKVDVTKKINIESFTIDVGIVGEYQIV